LGVERLSRDSAGLVESCDCDACDSGVAADRSGIARIDGGDGATRNGLTDGNTDKKGVRVALTKAQAASGPGNELVELSKG